MSEALHDHEVIPDVVDIVPSEVLKIKYGSLDVSNGNVLTPTQVFNPPTMISWAADSSAFYTLCMTDPDAPNRQDPNLGEVLHWLIVNVPGNDLTKGETIVEYVGSGPRKGTGLHRYVFLAYKQPGSITCTEPKIPKTSRQNRIKFSIRRFSEKYGLSLVAANFYQAEYDETTHKVHEQMGSA
ncbi:hypothetical protein SK128_003258 [Halocaridina rubra]|uniref:Phosphatidylethanolamine-binding protein n=1 Tax=Halocaridina rubra TaxID=373956 RepID=A0AAN9AGU9_HALRR